MHVDYKNVAQCVFDIFSYFASINKINIFIKSTD